MGTKSIKAQYTIKYSGVHGFYWSVFCSSVSFAAVFLLSKNFNNSQIGMVLAIANILAVILQPIVAAFADTTKKVSMKNLITIFVGLAAFFTLARFFVPDGIWMLAVVLILELTILFTLQPLVNSLGMQLINKGIAINFGLARGIGSVAYAITSYLLGVVVVYFGADSLTVISLLLYILLGIIIFTFTKKPLTNIKREIPSIGGSESKKLIENKKKGNLVSFITSYKRFSVLIFAIALTFVSHTMINNYLIQITENVGGNTKDMGIATGIAAVIELPAMILFGYLVKKFRCSSILKYSLFFFMIKSVVTVVATNVWMLYAAQIFQFGAYALFIPASIYYVNRIIAEEDSIKGQAFMTSAITLGGVGASLLGGWLLDGLGVHAMLFAGMAASILGFVIGLWSTERTEI